MNNDLLKNVRVDLDEPEHIKKLYDLYDKYQYEYKDLYIKHLSSEEAALKQEFPNVKFIPKARIKSRYSYISKVNKKIEEGKSGNIYDIFANRYIICSVDGNDDEELLIHTCYKFVNFLSHYNNSLIEIKTKRKDYISHPKNTTYQALHMSRIHCYPNVFFTSETQLRTLSMEENAKYGKASHKEVYKDRSTIDESMVPTYLIPSNFANSNGIYEVKELSFADSFQYFYGLPYQESPYQL